MIVKAILAPLFVLIGFIITLLPNTPTVAYSLNSFTSFLSKGLYFVDIDLFYSLIVSIMFWAELHLAWAIIEWIYKKIPGID